MHIVRMGYNDDNSVDKTIELFNPLRIRLKTTTHAAVSTGINTTRDSNRATYCCGENTS